MNILLVDDEPMMLASLSKALLAAGMQATSVMSAEAGLAALKAKTFDVVVLDIWMPNMDGLAFIKSLRCVPYAPRILAMTGGGPALATETVAAIAGIWGAERLFMKPFDENDLIQAIRNPPGKFGIVP